MRRGWKILILVAGILFLIASLGSILFLLSRFDMNQLPLVGEKVVIIPIKGTITTEGCDGLFGSGSCTQVYVIKEKLKEADRDNSVRAIILDINSGGGSVVATGEIAEAVKKVDKPVIGWIEEAGASGAYYVASASDRIVANKDSLTGGIGVIMVVQHYYGLFEKLGINVSVIKAGKSKDIGSPYRQMTLEERKRLEGMVDKIYQEFVQEIADNRGLTYEYVENLSDGSLYLGSEAKDLGLVDELGGRDEAIEIAKRLGGIKGEPAIIEYTPKRSVFDLLSRMSESMGYGLARGIIRIE